MGVGVFIFPWGYPRGGLINMATIKVETRGLHRDYGGSTEVVEVSGREEKDVVLRREIMDIEDFVWALEAKSHEVIRDLWKEVKDSEEFEEFGWYSPYPKGDITVSSSYDLSWHDVVEYIAEREEIPEEEKGGIYMDLRTNRRTPDGEGNNVLLKAFLEFAAEHGVDTSYWVHGKSEGSIDSIL